ncbi:MAG: ABC transporter permease [Candidatus Thermoplasmatota archaeon]|nr:ABC transporter permease [Candidatus Thermoplasmatota archaeon]
MALVPPLVTLLAGLAPGVLILLLLLAGISTGRNRASFVLGARMFVRSMNEGISRIFPVALLASIIIASLSVGDGLLLMVEENTDANLSGVDVIVSFPGFVREDIWERSGLDDEPLIEDRAATLQIEGIGENIDTSRRTGIKLYGADNEVLDMLGATNIEGREPDPFDERMGSYINQELASELALKKGDQFHVTINNLGVWDDSLLGYSSSSRPITGFKVVDIISNKGIGRFREDSLGRVDNICVVDLEYLQSRIDREGRINKVLVVVKDGSEEEAIERIHEGLNDGLQTIDAGFEIAIFEDTMQLRHSDIFFHPEKAGLPPDAGTLSYFVDNLTTMGSRLSYSVVTGVHPDADVIYEGASGEEHRLSISPGEVLINNWTAERLGVTVGESVSISYRKVTELGTLVSESRYFIVKNVYTMEGWIGQDIYMPVLPGITLAPSCGEWDPSFDIDLDSLTGNDFEYWDLYRTIPKCFINLDEAREIWGIPSGNTTMVILGTGKYHQTDVDGFIEELSRNITLESTGGSIRNVRKDARESSRAMLIFPGMFLTFGSIIMIGAMLVLYALFKDLAARRAHEWGILRGMGISRKHLILTGMFEALSPIILGAVMGLPMGYFIGFLLNLGLGSTWADSVEGAGVPFSIGPQTIIISLGLTLFLALLLAFISVIMEIRGAPIANLRDEDPKISIAGRSVKLRTLAAAILLTIGGMVVLYLGSGSSGMSSAGLFVLGSIMTSSGAGLILYVLVARVSDRSDLSLMVSSNLSRRPGKNPLSIAILSLMLTLALSLTFMGSLLEEDVTTSYDEYGGGYTWVVETAVPFRGDLELPEMEVSVLLSIGEEGGTCSNINAPYPPRLLGVEEDFDQFSDFGLVSRDGRFGSDREAWRGLHERIEGMVPILVDQNTLQWIYFESLGAEFQLTSESGKELTLLVVGVLEPSVLTGTFVMSKDILKEEFPSLAKPTYFLLSGNGGDQEKEKVASAFSDSFPKVEWVGDLASDNLHYELSYLYLFRDFLVFGLVVAMTSAAIFTHARALSLKREVITLRALGVTRRRSIQYFLTENMVIFSVATIGSILGSAVSVAIFGPVLGGGAPSVSALPPVLIVVVTFLAVTIVFSLISAYRAMVSVGRLSSRN